MIITCKNIYINFISIIVHLDKLYKILVDVKFYKY